MRCARREVCGAGPDHRGCLPRIPFGLSTAATFWPHLLSIPTIEAMEKMRVPLSLSNLLLGACMVFGVRSGTEQPSYKVTERFGLIEVRQYGARIAAEITFADDEAAARSDGFRKLARYIFGDNVSRQSIAMTAPVAQQIAMTAPVGQMPAEGGAWTIRFFLPAVLMVETAPAPLDPAIHIVAVPPASMAVLRFSGIPRPARVAIERKRLMSGLRASSWMAMGDPVTWFYESPWALPWLRRNEVAVEVQHLSR
jgi:hypothetical protein